MRTILFRGKNLDGQWVTGSLVQDGNKCWIVSRGEAGWEWTPVVSRTVARRVYTIDDKDLYIGDIIEVVDKMYDERYVGRVVFDQYGLRLVARRGWTILTKSSEIERDCDDATPNLDYYMSDSDHECRVIGNVWDNLELLEGGT